MNLNHHNDNYKRRDILTVARQAYVRNFLRCYRENDLDNLSSVKANLDSNQLSYYLYFVELLGAYDMELRAQRMNQKYHFDITTKTILPLISCAIRLKCCHPPLSQRWGWGVNWRQK